MHKVTDVVAERSQLPVLRIADVAGNAIAEHGLSRVGLLGTRCVMDEPLYRDRLKKRFDIDVVVPAEDEQAVVHRIIYGELCRGEVSGHPRRACLDIIEKLVGRGG